MSQTKKLKSLLLAIFTIFTFFVFGCGDTKVDVNNIKVNLESQSQIVLLVDDFFDLTGKVEISPSYATDKTFSIYSLNENVARIVGNKIVAEGVGETFIRVVSNSNENVEDIISISVVAQSITLNKPTALEYDENLQTFKFNPVDNASSYTININGLETNIGNVNVFKLSDYVGKKFNELLKVKVRANAPTHTKAYLNSNYSDEIKIYQTEKVKNVSIVGGKLKFVNNVALVYDVYFDSTKMFSQLTSGEIDLNALSEELAGTTKRVTVVASPSARIKEQINQSGVTYVSSTSDEIVLNILGEPEIEMKGDIVSWNAIPFVDSYTVFIGSNPIIVENNYLDLSSLSNYAQLGATETKVKVKSNLSSNSKNLSKTTKQSNEISFIRLQTPTISLLENGFEWNAVDNAGSYFVEVKIGGNVLFSASTNSTSFDLSKYGAGTYDIKVYAVANNEGGNYLSSQVASLTIVKHGEISAAISDYVLNIATVINEKYLITIDDVQFGDMITAQGNNTQIDLSNDNFTAGAHNIKIKQLGNGVSSVNGIEIVVSFTQLEAETISISNSVASVTKSNINQNAIISLEINGGELSNSIVINSENYTFNTTISGNDFLAAGNYNIVAYVKGNGSSTFSYRGTAGGKNAIACEKTNFTVLAAPQISIGENGISWTTENANKYNIQIENVNESKFEIDNNNASVTSVDMSSYNAGTYFAKIRANGHDDSCNYVASQISSVQIIKHELVDASIENYELNISTTANEKYLVKFIIDDNNSYNETLTASSNEIKIDLSGYNFKSGLHNIEITQLGNATNTINGLTRVVSFTQLELANVVINSSIASVTKSTINQNATIALQISGGALVDVINIDADNYTFNTTNASAENLLVAGDYTIVAFVKGDGRSTFSYRGTAGTGKDAVACEGTNFIVLTVPGLEVLDFSKAEISVKTVANAANYSILNENEQILDASVTDKYAFDLASGETKKFSIRANGNGSTTLSSLSSDVITIKRLVTPTLTFYPVADVTSGAQDNSFLYSANNNATLYNSINFYHNDNLITYAAGSTFIDFVAGVNRFEVDLTSKGLVEGVYYINSFADKIEINKYLTTTKIYTDNNNNIVVENPNNEKLFIDLTINGVTYVDNGSNQIVNGSIVLDYTYSSGKYFVNIFDNNGIKIAGVNQGNDISVQAQFRRTGASNNVDSDISSEFSIHYLTAPTFVRADQNIYFEGTYADYDLEDYKLIVKNEAGTIQKTISMSTIAGLFSVETTATSTKYTIAMADLWDVLNGGGFVVADVNSISIQILNTGSTQENPTLSSYGAEIFVQQAQSFVINTEKVDGLTYVKVQTIQTDYAKTYVINVLGETEHSNNDGSIITISLDDKEFIDNKLNISGYVKTTSSYNNGKVVYVFNSLSIDLNIDRLATTSLSVKNNIIKYDLVSGATSYEVYKLGSSGYEKIDSNLLDMTTGGVIKFKNFAENTSITICVKAITDDNTIVNSNYSELITICKLGKASTEMINGKVGIKLPSGWQQAVKAGVQLKLALGFAGRKYDCNITYDATNETYSTSIKGITWSQGNDAFMVDSNLIFNYSDAYIIEKTLKIGLELNGAYEGKYYLYSDIYETAVKGLFAPTNVKVNKQGDYVERLAWKNNDKNSLTNGGTKVDINQYVFAFIYGGETYYSNDAKLKYKISTEFASYENVYTAPDQNGYYSASFPYGYDVNEDGDFDDENDVVFGEGDYSIMVAAYKNGYATSPYSDVYTFKVLPQTEELSITDGKLTWDAVANATSYVVRIKNLLSSVIATKEIATGLIYDFEDFYGLEDVVCENEFYYVTVQAITTNSGMLNSKESESLMFYRLPVASEVKIDDGVLKVAASPFAYAIDVIYNGQTYRFENPEQESKILEATESGNLLQIMTTVKNVIDKVYTIDLTSNKLELMGANDDIDIRICGNTGVVYDAASMKVGMVNSRTIQKSITAQVLKTNINEVKSGVWNFNQNAELGTTSKAQLNYNFNNVTNIHPFWLDTIVYQINFDVTNCDTLTNHIIYAVDYNRFISAVNLPDGNAGKLTQDNTQQTYYELCYDKLGLYARIIYKYDTNKILYFNVYLDDVVNSDGDLVKTGNIINLQDHNVLYYSPISYDTATQSYLSENVFSFVNLAAGGSFVVNIRTLGGDELSSIAYLNSPNVEQTFVRYGVNRVSTLNGEMVINDFKIAGKASPIYKIGVIPLNHEEGVEWTYIYLYDPDGNKLTAEDVRKFLKLPADAICEPMIFIEGTNQIAFEMSKYFNPANYQVNVRTLAGIDADDYLLNAKIPEPEDVSILSVFNDLGVSICAGNIVFNSSSVNRDGTFYYADNYEISVIFEGNEYKQTFNVNDLNCKKEGNTITYILPSSIGGLAITNRGNYEFKIRAITSLDSLVNSKFSENKQFTRETSVTNVRIEEGILKWTASETGNYLIKVTKVENNETVIITTDYTRNGNSYIYEFKEQDFPIWGKGTTTKIYSNTNYTISVSRVGNNTDKISSSYVDKTNVERIADVDAEEIVTNLGILTWTQIEDATGYILEMVGTSGTSGNYKYTISTNINSIDLASVTYDGSENLLPAGKYKAKIRVLGGGKINSLLTTSEKEFTKLNSVLNRDVEFKVNETTKDTEIVWTTITGTNKYIVRFEYINVLGELVDVTHNNVEGDRIVAPTDVAGRLITTIIAYSGDAANLLNSNALIVETKTDAPKPIKELTYNDVLNRFEWKVDDSDFTNSDKLIVRYNFVEFELGGNLTSVAKVFEINHEEIGRYDDELGIYYFNISVMGKFENFTVTVHRNNNIDATSSSIEKTLNLFACGAGTEDKPYIVENQTMLDNMNYYPNAYYKLNSDISIIDKTYTSAILDFEFNGYIDGTKSSTENYKIDLSNIELRNVQEFALFSSLNGATITNLDISGNIENIINNQITGDVKIALLAIDSVNTTLTNVRIITSAITVNENEENVTNEIVGNLYIAGYFAIDNNSTLTNCYIVEDGSNRGLIINLDVDVSVDEYVGSISAYANKTHIDGGKYNVEITNQESLVKYIGGLFGYYIGDDTDNKNCLIQNTEVNILINNVNTTYIGGIVGFAKYLKIQNNTVSGNIEYTDISDINLYLGGIAGVVESGLIYKNTINAEIRIDVVSVGNGLNIGLVVGSLSVDENKFLTCELKGDYSEISDKTNITTGVLTLGLYGVKADSPNVSVDKNYTE